MLPLLAAMAGGVLLVHATAAAVVLWVVARGQGIGDWTSFYAAGTLVRTGQGGALFDAARQEAVQRALFGEGMKLNGYPLPAFVAVALSPLTRLSFGASFWLWLGMNSAVLAVLARAMWRHLEGVARPVRALAVGAAALSTPVVDTLLLGQFDLLVLTGLVGCYALLRRDRPGWAGAALALALIKPQAAAAAVLLLVVKGEWRALATFGAAAVALIGAPTVLLGAHTLRDEIALVASYPGSSSDYAVNAAMMINVRGAVASLTGSSNPWLWAPPLAAIAGVSVTVAVRSWQQRPSADARSWALALLLPLMSSPHVQMQTAVLAVGAAALYARAMADAGREVRAEEALLAYTGIGVLWILSVAGASVTFAPLLVAFALAAGCWPQPTGERSANAGLARAAQEGASGARAPAATLAVR